MEPRLDALEGATARSACLKSDKAVEDYLKKKNIKREMDVVELFLAKQELKELKSLKRFKNLSRLWLQSNKLQKLPFILNCDSLSELYLQDNLIQTIDNCFRSLTNISVLFLNANQLTDLNNVAHELSYLKYLKNLTLRESDRIRSFKIYEPERVEINSRHAFMRSINPDAQLSKEKHAKKSSPITNRSMLNHANEAKSMRRFRHRDFDYEESDCFGEQQQQQQQQQLRSLAQGSQKALKEFSYFDWSKVKLCQNDYLINEASTTTVYNTNHDTNAHISKQAAGDLPQVITIRFT